MKIAPVLSLCVCLSFSSLSAGPVSVAVGPEFDIGWDAGAWNKARFTFTSAEGDWTVRGLKASWKGLEGGWTAGANLEVPEGKSAVWVYDLDCPEAGYGLFGKDEIVLQGEFSLQKKNSEDTLGLPFEAAVKRAVLPEPLTVVTGRHVKVMLQKSRFEGETWQTNAVPLMDEVFEAMEELVGSRPHGDELTEIMERPNHCAWAYTYINRITLNDQYVPETIEEFKENFMSFGWTHELGHVFDGYRQRYFAYNSAGMEFQANLKLIYAFEHIPSRDRLRVRWGGTEKYPLDRNAGMPICEMGDKVFLCIGDAYLADPSRTWESLTADEIHSFFHRIVKVYGWDAIKRWYRLLVAAYDAGKPVPDGGEETINFHLAALNKACGYNLLKMYRTWRLPVTEESLKAAAEKYGF